MSKYFSRKFVLTVFISVLAVLAPVVYKDKGVSDMVLLAVLGILSGIGVAYGFLNVKEAKLNSDKKE
jgi:hypothetical protein